MLSKKNILIIGAGIAGISAAVELAEVGHNVILVEKLPYLGGRVIRMNQYFPKLCPPYCGLEINFRRIKQNPRINVNTNTVVEKIEGTNNNFTVHLISAAEYVNKNCTCCGECKKVCPVEIPDQFNYDLTKTKAIQLPHELCYPFRYNIDDSNCLKERCKKCLEVCDYNAIKLDAVSRSFTVHVNAIIIATGWRPYDASKIENLNYEISPDIITNIEMERIAAVNGPGQGKIIRPSDKKTPNEFVFVQCAGSRDEKHLPYCSAVCCAASFKQAINIREQIPESKIKIYYIDLRVAGRNEDLLTKVKEDNKIELIKGKVSRINKDTTSNQLIIEVEDIMSGRKCKQKADLVILATGMQASTAEFNSLEFDQFGYINSDKIIKGIFPAACAKRPMDVASSIKDACSAALKAIQIK